MTTILSTANPSTYNWTSGDLTVTGTGNIFDSGGSGLVISSVVGTLTLNGPITAEWAINNGGTVDAIINNSTVTGNWALINGVQTGQPATIRTFTNNGTIGGPDYGVINSDGSTIGTLNNSGTLGGADYGIINSGTIGTINNSGTIVKTGFSFLNYGVIGTLDNTGFMLGGIEMAGGSASIANLINSGTFGSQPSGIAFNNSLSSLTATTITNSGTFAGGILLSPNADIVNIQGGIIQGDIAASYAGHGTVNIQVGSGNSYVSDGNIGEGSGSTQGFVVGTVNLDSGTLSIGFSQLNATAIDFVGSKTVLALTGTPQSLASTISGFAVGDVIDFVRNSVTSATLNANDQLVIVNNATTLATLQLGGNYSHATFNIVGDGASGSDIEIIYSAANAVNYASSIGMPLPITDSSQDVLAALTGLQPLAAAGEIASIVLTDKTTPALTVSAAELSADLSVFSAIATPYSVVLSDSSHPLAVSSAQFSAGLSVFSAITSPYSIVLTDSGTPALNLTAAQTVAYAGILKDISSSFALTIDASAPDAVVSGVANHATTVVLSGAASQYSVTPSGDGVGFILSTAGSTDHLANVSALQFSDATDIVASQTPSVPGGVSSAQVTELYGAVLGRSPDVAGLAFYQKAAATSPSTPFIDYALWFLNSSEYKGNSAHNYAQTSDGDAQFITDSYLNLLHRAPETGAVAFYQDKVIDPILSGLTPGTAAYGAAELQAHAQVLVYFSQSHEFLSNVTITAQSPASAQHWLVLI